MTKKLNNNEGRKLAKEIMEVIKIHEGKNKK